MVFSSIVFLFYFFPLVCISYHLVPARFKNSQLLIASLIFYAWGAGSFVFVLLASMFANYGFGILIDRARERGNPSGVRLGLACSICANLALLGYFKYANFAVSQFDTLARIWGSPPSGWTEVALPIGISFFTFQSMSYAFDVARGHARALGNPIDYSLYIALFPQLIAGPIVRFHEIADQIRARGQSLDRVAAGMVRLCHGLVKKVIVADSVGAIADAAFASPVETLTSGTAWLGALAYSVQIYFDFSGYSDMAIGMGMIFGFRIPENFRRPYSAISITDFWRRWHITLSTWFRDYVYLPLGGSRNSTGRTYLNLAIVFALTGMWHGANWTFLIWGAYHGTLLTLERLINQRPVDDAQWAALRRAGVFILVVLGWVVFRADSPTQAMAGYRAMGAFDFAPLPLVVSHTLGNFSRGMLLIGLGSALLPRDFVVGPLLAESSGPGSKRMQVLLLLLVPIALMQVVSGSFSPFLYFQF